LNENGAETLIVTYHYLTGEVFPGRGVHPFGLERFRVQLERLARTSRFLSLEDLLEERRPPLGGARRYALLTFDDGLAEQFEAGLPLLESMGIPAIFFPCTGPMENGTLLHVHRLHALRSALSDRDLLALFLRLAESRGFEESARAIALGCAEEAAYPYDKPEARGLKSLFNYTLPVSEREKISTLAFEEVFWQSRPWAERLYMSPAMLRELGRKGLLGTHTHSHRPLSSLGREGARKEIEVSVDLLEKTAGVRPRAVSYPYGGRLAVSPETFEAASDCGMACGFTTERRANPPGANRLQLGRFDAEDLYPGKRPLVDL